MTAPDDSDCDYYCRECGDARRLPLADESVDAIITDAPYEMGFQRRAWDRSGVALEGRRFILVENDPEYCAIAGHRVAATPLTLPLFAAAGAGD